ncbi:MAG: hypothetical protein QOF22_1175, partial [Bradyrhizobium sp.]|nr:hypothetical protein [Bradyrhizobium sp.]
DDLLISVHYDPNFDWHRRSGERDYDNITLPRPTS